MGRQVEGGRYSIHRLYFFVVRRAPEIPIFILFFLAAVFLTWPLLIHFNTSIYGAPMDNLGGIWQMWWIRSAGSFGAKANFSPLIGYPFGTALSTVPMEPIAYAFSRFLQLFMSEVTAYNVDTFLSFFLSGVTMYYLVRYLTRDRRAATFAGFAYLFGGYHAFYSMLMGSGISNVQWMPLYILLLIKFMREPTVRRVAWLGLGGFLVVGTSVHYGLFMAIFTVFFCIGTFAYGRIKERHRLKAGGLPVKALPTVNRRTLIMSVAVVLLITAVTLPFFALYVSNVNPPGKWPTSPFPSQVRRLEVSYQTSARPLDYLLPLFGNPLIGGISKHFAGKLGGSWHYLGWTVIILAVIGLFAAGRAQRRRRGPPSGEAGADSREPGEERQDPNTSASTAPAGFETRRMIWGFTVAAVACFVLSLSPYFDLGTARIPLPSRFILVFPWFRYNFRIGIVVTICFVVIAGFGLSWLFGKLKGVRKELLLALVVILLAFEMVMVPPFRSFDFQTIPGAFAALEKLPAKSAVAIYPLAESSQPPSTQYMFYQMWFKKPMLNGAGDDSDGEALRRTVFNPYEEETPAVLKRFGIEYVVVFNNIAKVKGVPEQEPQLPAGYQLLKRFSGKANPDVSNTVDLNNGRLFKVVSDAADFVPLYLGSDTSVPFLAEGDVTARFVNDSCTVRILNETGTAKTVDLQVPIANSDSPVELTVSQHGIELWKGNYAAGQQSLAELHGIAVQADGTELVISVKRDSATAGVFRVKLANGSTLEAQAPIILGDVRIIAP